MVIFFIPFHDKYIIYRPLVQSAFIGNKTTVELIKNRAIDKNSRFHDFLTTINFFAPDPMAADIKTKEYAPTQAVLLMTNRCSLRCIYCYADAGDKPGKDLSEKLGFKAVDVVEKNAGAKGLAKFELVFHGGGEPVLNWTVLKSVCRYARNKTIPCDISICSNGLWNDRQTEWLIENINNFTISFDGMEDVQNFQRPGKNREKSFDNVFKTIKTLDKSLVEYGIRLTVTPENINTLPESIRFLCTSTNCRNIQVEPAFYMWRNSRITPDTNDIDRFIKMFIKSLATAHKHNRSLTYSGARPWNNSSVFCTALYSSLIVSSSGELTGCYEVTDQEHPLYDIFTFGTLSESGIEINKEKRNFLMIENKNRLSRCNDCFCLYHCAGDCMVKNMNGEKKYGQAGVRCKINRAVTKEMILRNIHYNYDIQ